MTQLRVRRWILAIHLSFLLLGASWGSLLTRIPTLRDELGLTLTQISSIIFTVSIGVIVSLGIAGRLEGVVGARRLLIAGMLLSAVGLPVGTWLLMNGHTAAAYVALTLYGVGFGVGDVANNVSGSRAEQAAGRPRMSVIHAGFSIGGILAVLTGAWAEAANVDVVLHHVFTGTLVAIGAVLISFWVVPEKRRRRQGVPRPPLAPAWRDPRVLLLGFIALAGSLADGVGGDWMPLAFIDEYGLGNDQGVLVLSLMFGSTLVLRLVGDRFVARVGRVYALRITFVCGLVGVLLVALSPVTWLAIPGALLWGAGDALAFPLTVSAATDDPARAARNVSTVSAIAYTAYVGGPVLFGFLGDAFGLRAAFVVLAVILALALLTSKSVRDVRTPERPTETA